MGSVTSFCLGNLSGKAALWEHNEAVRTFCAAQLCVVADRAGLGVDAAGKHSCVCSLSDDVISEPALLSRLQGGAEPCNEEEAAPGDIPAEPGAGKGGIKALILGMRVLSAEAVPRQSLAQGDGPALLRGNFLDLKRSRFRGTNRG